MVCLRSVDSLMEFWVGLPRSSPFGKGAIGASPQVMVEIATHSIGAEILVQNRSKDLAGEPWAGSLAHGCQTAKRT